MTLAHPGHVIATLPAGTVALRALLLVAAAVLAGTAVASRRAWTLPLLSVPVLVATAGTSGWFRVSVALHVAAGAVWLGSVLRVVAARRGQRQAVLQRMAPLAMTSAVAVAVSGTAQALADRVRLDGIAFDRLVLVKAALLVLATALGVLGTRHLLPKPVAGSGNQLLDLATGPGTHLPLLELGALLSAAAIGAALVAVPTAPPAGRPISSAFGTLVPQRPGANYLHIDGRWQRLELRAGRSTLQLAAERVLVDTGHRRGLQPDGRECATALLVKPALTQCPDQVLEPEDAAALAALTGWLRGRGVRAVGVQADGSPRSRRAAAVLGAAAAHPQALVLTGTWESASAALQRLGPRVPEGGVYLAPWLLEGTLLSRYATTAPLVVLPFEPKGTAAVQYAASLPAGETPTAAGYRAWGGPMRGPAVWATTPASIFPTSLGHDHGSAGGWFPGGALVAVADLHSDGSRERVARTSMSSA